MCADEPTPQSDWLKVALRIAGAPTNIGVSDRKVRTAFLMYLANISSLIPTLVVFSVVPGVVIALINFIKPMVGAFHLKSCLRSNRQSEPIKSWLTPPYQFALSVGMEAFKAGALLGLGHLPRAQALR